MSGVEMSEINDVRDYFVKAADLFDSLYSEKKSNKFMRFINRKFRSDIYERFNLSMEHIKSYEFASLLDVGCGSGRYALAFSKLGLKRIVGIDISNTMIDLAIKYNQLEENIENPCEFLCEDFMKWQTSEKFDVVVAMGLFDYISDPEVSLRKMQSLANHSVIVSFPSINIYRTAIRKIRYRIKKCPLYFYKPDQIEELSQTVGFSNVKITKIKGAGMDYFVSFIK